MSESLIESLVQHWGLTDYRNLAAVTIKLRAAHKPVVVIEYACGEEDYDLAGLAALVREYTLERKPHVS